MDKAKRLGTKSKPIDLGWLEYSIEVSGEACEIGWQFFNRYLQNVSLEQPPDADEAILRGYVRDDGTDLRARFEVMLELIRAVLDLREFVVLPVSPENWGETWKANFPPLRIGKRLVLKPSWAEFETSSGDVVVNIDPRMAFGTGHHPTTRLCLEMLESLGRPGPRVLDVGTGSAVLALAAIELGAEKVVALDNDSEAVREATENASRAGLHDRLLVVEGGLPHELVISGTFELAMANITVHVVDLILGEMADVILPGGQAIISGFQGKDTGRIEARALEEGFVLTQNRVLDDWVAFLLRRL